MYDSMCLLHSRSLSSPLERKHFLLKKEHVPQVKDRLSLSGGIVPKKSRPVLFCCIEYYFVLKKNKYERIKGQHSSYCQFQISMLSFFCKDAATDPDFWAWWGQLGRPGEA